VSLDKVAEIFEGAVRRQTAERSAYLDRMCGGNLALRREVEQLLEYDRKTSSTPAPRNPTGTTVTSPVAGQAPLEYVGPYKVGSLLGAGGMGQVFLATDRRLGRQVALKTLHAELTAQDEARSRFLREARSAAALQHPNIAAVYDAGEADGRLFLAMEFIEGKPLRRLLVKGGLPEDQVLRVSQQIAAAIEHAHGRGILHRDIKPDNVMIDGQGTAKLVDFGIAKALETAGSETLTKPGMFVGTLKYAAPEVISGQNATRASDLYSLGILMFEMLCGETPFDALPPLGFIGAILHGAPIRLRELRADASERLADVVEHLIARAPAERLASATDLVAELRLVGETGAFTRPRSAVPANGVVVLGFRNTSGESSTEWFSTGLAESIENELRASEALKLVAAKRAQQVIRALDLDPLDPGAQQRLANQLEARWVVSGSFQRAGSRIRVMPAVLDVQADARLAVEKVDGQWDDLFDVQDQVAKRILDALGAPARASAAPPPMPSLDAYELYARGRQALNRMDPESLAAARQHFERAIAADPKYALAHSGLGAVRAMIFLQTGNPEELRGARPNLEAAVALDPELGEPYPWLGYLCLRLGEVSQAVKYTELGTKLQPDYPESHYFHATVMLAASETGLGSLRLSVTSLLRALNLEPKMHAAWMALSWSALATGNHAAAATVLDTAWQMEKTPNLPARFVGARTLLGLLRARKREWDAARNYHRESIDWLRDRAHVFSALFTALSACSLGEIEYRMDSPDRALEHFRHAWRVAQENPRVVGNVRLRIRTQAGMAAAYAASGETERAERNLAEASAQAAKLDVTSAGADLLLPDLHYAIAVAQAALGLAEEPAEQLRKAVDRGWADAEWLENDPAWRNLREHADFQDVLRRVRLIPRVEIDETRLPPSAKTLSAGTVPP
jgi:serine/threonine protein kinase/tetratricopeptide (TPR) repeat protein